MKKVALILTFILLLFGSGGVQAQDEGPWLVCDPMSDENVTHFEIELNDQIIRAERHSVNATHFKIKYSISDLDPGSYEARARSANDQWDKTSEWTEPITWTVPSDSDMPSCDGFGIKEK